jgi:hypothetical protein
MVDGADNVQGLSPKFDCVHEESNTISAFFGLLHEITKKICIPQNPTLFEHNFGHIFHQLNEADLE